MYLRIDRRANVWYESIDSVNAIITKVGDFCKTRLEESSIGGMIGNTVGDMACSIETSQTIASRVMAARSFLRNANAVSANDTIPRRCVV